jgi:hypothetical protein
MYSVNGPRGTGKDGLANLVFLNLGDLDIRAFLNKWSG